MDTGSDTIIHAELIVVCGLPSLPDHPRNKCWSRRKAAEVFRQTSVFKCKRFILYMGYTPQSPKEHLDLGPRVSEQPGPERNMRKARKDPT
jgi:hypothetical protein